jgi:hypothetical protein
VPTNFWKNFQKNTTRQERVDLIVAYLVKHEKFSRDSAVFRFQDAVEKRWKSIVIVSAVVATAMFFNLQLISLTFDLIAAIAFVTIALYLVTFFRKNSPEFGLTTLLTLLSLFVCILAAAMLLLPQFPMLIAIVGTLGTALTVSVGLHWLFHLVQINVTGAEQSEF